MRKSYFTLIFVFCIHLLFGQLTNISFGIFTGAQFDKVLVLSPNKYIQHNFLSENSPYVPYISFTFKNKYEVSFEFTKQYYFGGYIFTHPKSQFGGWDFSVDKGATLNILGGYYFFDENYKINIIPEIGFGILKSGYYYARPIMLRNWTNHNKDGSLTIAKLTSEWKKDFGLHKYYIFFKLNTKIIYKPFEYFTVFFKSGYNQGFKTIGIFRGWVQVADEPVVQINNKSNGTYFFMALGVQINFQINNNKKI